MWIILIMILLYVYISILFSQPVCQNVSTGSKCTCEPGHRWSDKVCKAMKCCGNDTCTFPRNPPSMCIAENTGIDHNSSVHMRRREHISTNELTCFSAVSVIGSITLRKQQYFHCLADRNSQQFKECDEKLLKTVDKVVNLVYRDRNTCNKQSVKCCCLSDENGLQHSEGIRLPDNQWIQVLCRANTIISAKRWKWKPCSVSTEGLEASGQILKWELPAASSPRIWPLKQRTWSTPRPRHWFWRQQVSLRGPETRNDYFHILRWQRSGYSHGADLEAAAVLMVLAYV